eukprot:Amastigsp_a174612_161.p1 type:complete len:220 gc:universal Amastigsp_a174612_161:871-212(-)
MAAAGSSDAEKADFGLKIVLLGDTGVGKTTILNRQIETAGAPFRPATTSTIGITFKSRLYSIDGSVFRIEYWDSPGADRYKSMCSRICAGAAGAVLVYDVTSKSSFEHLEDWLAQAEKHRTLPKVLVANKADASDDRRQVLRAQGELFASKHEMQYFETSVALQDEVHAAFSELFALILDGIPDPPEPSQMLRRGVTIMPKLARDAGLRQALFLAKASS